MVAGENDHDGSRRHGSLAARNIRGRPRHGTGARTPTVHLAQARHVSQTLFPTKPDTSRSLEPILIPKLRVKLNRVFFPRYFFQASSVGSGFARQ
ncbi:2-dehydro-3-deoxygluconokinase [Lasius niger]|uniref:2-dehydro-3-deoxygluconokinase n=1 Tax=Lasius niger TaxID=67767 RepID=A0A0J7KQA4_LASNI|nr:2-dehydro-3-deoxygluconokinase [Lasius niger]